MVNWALNKLPQFHSMDLRHKVNGDLYQTYIHKSGGIRVGKPTFITRCPGAITYDWNKELTYEKLDVDAITTSVMRADIINAAKMEGRLVSEQQISEQLNPQTDWSSLWPEEHTQIKLVQTERNCWDAVLTEEERNLIGEFLDI